MFGRNSLLPLKMHKYLHLGISPCWPDWSQNLGLKRSFVKYRYVLPSLRILFFFFFFFPPASEFLFLALAENQLDKYSLFLHGHFGSWQGNEVAIYSEYCLINSRNSTVYQVYCSFAHKKSHKTQNMNNLILMLLLTLLFNINNI